MPVVIAMLRGINVGGGGKLPMADLRAVCLEMGLVKPETYIQSGNVLFDTDARGMVALAGRLEKALFERFGIRSPVLLRSAAELGAILDANPFAGRADYDASRFGTTFLAQAMTGVQRASVESLPCATGEEIVCREREVLVYYPQGMGQSKLMAALDRVLKMPATTRNANTVEKLRDMAAARFQ